MEPNPSEATPQSQPQPTIPIEPTIQPASTIETSTPQDTQSSEKNDQTQKTPVSPGPEKSSQELVGLFPEVLTDTPLSTEITPAETKAPTQQSEQPSDDSEPMQVDVDAKANGKKKAKQAKKKNTEKRGTETSSTPKKTVKKNESVRSQKTKSSDAPASALGKRSRSSSEESPSPPAKKAKSEKSTKSKTSAKSTRSTKSKNSTVSAKKTKVAKQAKSTKPSSSLASKRSTKKSLSSTKKSPSSTRKGSIAKASKSTKSAKEKKSSRSSKSSAKSSTRSKTTAEKAKAHLAVKKQTPKQKPGNFNVTRAPISKLSLFDKQSLNLTEDQLNKNEKKLGIDKIRHREKVIEVYKERLSNIDLTPWVDVLNKGVYLADYYGPGKTEPEKHHHAHAVKEHLESQGYKVLGFANVMKRGSSYSYPLSDGAVNKSRDPDHPKLYIGNVTKSYKRSVFYPTKHERNGVAQKIGEAHDAERKKNKEERLKAAKEAKKAQSITKHSTNVVNIEGTA